MLLLFLQLLLVLENLKNHAEYRSEESKEIKQPDHFEFINREQVGKMFGGCFEQDLTSCWLQIRRSLGPECDGVKSR